MEKRRSDRHGGVSMALLLLLLLTCSSIALVATAAPAAAEAAAAASELLHLYPETPRVAERLRCGLTQLYRVHDLEPRKVYDVKVSYPASIPAEFILEVDQVLIPASLLAPEGGDGDDGAAASTMPVRRLNTAKLRLHPQELLISALRKHESDSKSRTYRLDLLKAASGGGANGDAAKQRLPQKVSLDISLRAEVEGVSPVIDPLTRECVFDIVVEEMLLGGAFPYDTLVLIAWLALLLLLALKCVYPRLLRKIALERPNERIYLGGGSGAGGGGNIKES